jgi:drug/metabolite transporter (DMT)-like permease
MVLAATAWSLAGVLQRELSPMSVSTQLAGRAGFAFLALLAYLALSEGRGIGAAFRSTGWWGAATAVCMAVASGTFFIALNHTTVANVLFIQAASPVVAALLAWAALGERVSRATTIAMAIALVGVAVMIGAPGAGGLAGIGISLLMMTAFAGAIVIARHRRDVSMAPATCLAQLLLVLVTAPFADPGAVGGRDVAVLLTMGIVQMGLGLALFAAAAQVLPAAEIALVSLLEVVLGPLWVWLAFSEQPSSLTLFGGAIVVVAVVVQTLGDVARPGRTAAPPP